MKTVIFVILCVVMCQGAIDNIFQTSCPIGCADSVCYISLGCTRCIPGYCLYHGATLGTNRIGVCLPENSCGDGRYCNKLALAICTNCGDDCKKCSDRNTCIVCNYGYELNNGRCERRRIG